MRNFNLHIKQIFWLLLISFSATGQVRPSASVKLLQPDDPGEKVFVHFSQTAIISGELLWFSLFVTDAQSHRPSVLSKIAYAELLDGSNTPLIRDKILLGNGSGFGSFYIPASIPSGVYVFRAYTSWMKNSEPEFYFHKEIRIVNTLRTPETFLLPATSSTPSVSFFPEGGHLVNGLKSRVGFHVKDQSGYGIDAKGFLISGKDTVASLQTGLNGLGDFHFTPKKDASFSVVLKDQKGIIIPAQLPDITDFGLVISLEDRGEGNFTLRMQASEPLKGNVYRLLLHCRSSLIEDHSVRLSEGYATHTFTKKSLGPGINHLTILNEEGQPVAERLIFKKPDPSAFKVFSGQQVYNVRSRAQVSWSGVPDSLTRLSVAVVRTDSLDSGIDIVSGLYLSSDLHGLVETPEYYFSDNHDAEPMADILMLTHGWRRFDVSNLHSGKARSYRFLPELKAHLISARILDASEKPVPGKTAYLAEPGKIIRLYTAMSDSAGRLFFEVKPGMRGSRLIIQPDRSDSLLHVIAESPFSDKYRKLRPSILKLSPLVADGLTQRSIDMQVQDIFREQETFFTTPPPAQDTIPFYGTPDESYRLDDYVRFPSIEEVLREFVKGVWVRKKEGNFSLTILDKDVNRMFDKAPVLLVDGVPVRNANRLFEADALKIRQIDVVTRKFFTGPLVTEGLISLHSYNGDMAGLNPDRGSAIADLSGLEEKRIFHAPSYGTIQSRESRLPDRRRVLSFNHHLSAGPGLGIHEFYTSDVEGNYFIIVNGLTPAGLPFTGTAEFRVSR
ncbi:MAG: hypothetical protein ACO3FI_08830 [Cyclobacteriaceae bacterium]